MPLYPFRPNDVFRNQIKTHPEVSFWIYDTRIYYNNRGVDVGAFHSQSLHVEPGYLSLYEMNVDRDINKSRSMIYPFITKESGISAFNTVSTSDFNAGYLYGEEIAGKYPLSATLGVEFFRADEVTHHLENRRHLGALENTLNYYKPLSQHYAYSSSLGDKASQDLRLLSVPSIFYGSSIKKGSVSLQFYITGTLAAELRDINKNGELIQVSGTANSTNLLSIDSALSNVTITDLGISTSETTKKFQIEFTAVPDLNDTITIVSYDGTSKAYIAKNAQDLTTDPPQFDLTSGTDASVISLKACIENTTNGHGTRLSVSTVGTKTLIITDQATGEGSCAGVVLYNEGFMILTGSWLLDPDHEDYYNGSTYGGGGPQKARWVSFGQSLTHQQDSQAIAQLHNNSVTSTAWQVSFKGTNYIPTLTMFAHAPKGWLNHSNNPTYKNFGQATFTDVALSSSIQYSEPEYVTIKNTISSSWEVLTASYNTKYQENSASFKKQTFISKIGIYDEKKNLIAVAKMARPVKKTEQDDFTFKLKLDF